MNGHPTSERTGIIERATYPSDAFAIDVWVMRPVTQGRFPVILYNHGSKKRADGYIDSGCPTLSFDTPVWAGVSAGLCAVVFPEGRGYGASTGPGLEACHDMADVWSFLKGRGRDAAACAAWLTNLAWADTSRLIVCGCSHGGIVSLLAQADLNVCGSVLQAPATGDQAPEASMPDLIDALKRSKAPILLQHAEHDLHAPIEFSRSLCRLGRDSGKDMRLLEYPFQRSMGGHDQFAWRNRRIWGRDFNRFACQSLGVAGDLLGGCQ
ncbi:MAG: hypothetical protein AAGL24_07880 [Pseudomonadota bacterium]